MFNTKDPNLLLSIVNMKLRDEVPSLEELCKTYDQSEADIKERLNKIGYIYSKEYNQFVAK